jgi:hypothetical protein
MTVLSSLLDWITGGALEAAYYAGARDGAFGTAIVLVILYGLFGGRGRA